MPRDQTDLFDETPLYPEGFRYQPGVVDAATEARMLEHIAALPFREFEFQGYTAKRRVISFGWQYDFGVERLHRVDDMPDFLLERVSLVAEPRSAYLLSGASRSEWEHSIPAVDELRYSVTYRNLRE